MQIDTPDQRAIAAAEANRLRLDPAFQKAVLTYRTDTINKLVSALATDVDTIRDLQAQIKAVDGLCQALADTLARAPREPMAVA